MQIRKRFALIALCVLLVAAAAGCDASVATGTTIEKGLRAPEPDEAPIEEVPISTPLPADGWEESIVSFEPIEVATPVPVFSATPGPSESFSCSGDTITVRYYDMVNQEPVSTEYPVSDSSDPQAVVDAVGSALSEVLGEQNLKINSTNYSGGNLFVDFDPSIYDAGLDSGSERQVLESIADTYLTNVDGIKAVYYTVDGEPYTSEHTQLNANEAYKTLLDGTE